MRVKHCTWQPLPPPLLLPLPLPLPPWMT